MSTNSFYLRHAIQLAVDRGIKKPSMLEWTRRFTVLVSNYAMFNPNVSIIFVKVLTVLGNETAWALLWRFCHVSFWIILAPKLTKCITTPSKEWRAAADDGVGPQDDQDSSCPGSSDFGSGKSFDNDIVAVKADHNHCHDGASSWKLRSLVE